MNGLDAIGNSLSALAKAERADDDLGAFGDCVITRVSTGGHDERERQESRPNDAAAGHPHGYLLPV